MSTGWTAATVRAKAMARRRVGRGVTYRIAHAPDIAEGLRRLAGTPYEFMLERFPDGFERDSEDKLLWELRVLAGWMPPAGARIARVLAGRFEIANIEAQLRKLAGQPQPGAFQLGALATCWPRLSATTTPQEFGRALADTVWQSAGSCVDDPDQLHHALVAGWLQRVGAAVPGALDWASAAAGLMAARLAIVGRSAPPESVVDTLTPLIGRRWKAARTLPDLTATLPARTRWVLAGSDDPVDLWRAEIALLNRIESDGWRMLRSARPGPRPVLGCLAVLAIDAWRVRAALACNLARTTASDQPSEVVDAVA